MKIHFKNRRNEKIVGILKVPNKKSGEISILIHGFTSNKNSGSMIIGTILQKNRLNSLAIDLDNCGESSPNFEEMTLTKYSETIIDAIKYCEKLGFKKINIIGTSSGGLSTMIAALKYKKINSLILRSTNPSDAEWFKKRVGGAKGVALWKKNGFYIRNGKYGIKRVGYCYYADSLTHNMYKEARKIKIPTIILHGTSDDVVPISRVKKLVKNFPKAEFKIIEGGDHSLGVNGDYSESSKIIVDWLKKEKK